VYGSKAEKAFQDLKNTFTIAPILTHADFSKPFYMETNVFDFALRVILSQMGGREKLHRVPFHSRKKLATKINYEIKKNSW